jgi:hypothetical protein
MTVNSSSEEPPQATNNASEIRSILDTLLRLVARDIVECLRREQKPAPTAPIAKSGTREPTSASGARPANRT